MVWRFALGFLALVALAGGQSAPATGAGADLILRPYVRASRGELQRVDRGEALTRTIESRDSREITTLGVIRARCSIDTFVARTRDIERFKAGEYILEIGRFQPTPALQDVAALTITGDDRSAMRTCRRDDCPMRLPQAAMDRFRALPWKEGGDPGPPAMREFLVEEARRYLLGGSAALAAYSDVSDSPSRADAFRGLLRQGAFRSEYQPDVFEALEKFPPLTLEGAESLLYWSHEKFGLKATINITHSVVVRRENEAVFASKQVFTSHYFDASLGMAVFVPIPDTEYGYVTYMNRTRIEGLHGPLSGLVRSIAARRGRDGLAKTLLDVKKKLEAAGQ